MSLFLMCLAPIACRTKRPYLLAVNHQLQNATWKQHFRQHLGHSHAIQNKRSRPRSHHSVRLLFVSSTMKRTFFFQARHLTTGFSLYFWFVLCLQNTFGQITSLNMFSQNWSRNEDKSHGLEEKLASAQELKQLFQELHEICRGHILVQ